MPHTNNHCADKYGTITMAFAYGSGVAPNLFTARMASEAQKTAAPKMAAPWCFVPTTACVHIAYCASHEWRRPGHKNEQTHPHTPPHKHTHMRRGRAGGQGGTYSYCQQNQHPHVNLDHVDEAWVCFLAHFKDWLRNLLEKERNKEEADAAHGVHRRTTEEQQCVASLGG